MFAPLPILPTLPPPHPPRSDNSTANSCGGDHDKIVLPLDDNERVLGLQMALKCADVGHVTAVLPVHIRSAQGRAAASPLPVRPLQLQAWAWGIEWCVGWGGQLSVCRL